MPHLSAVARNSAVVGHYCGGAEPKMPMPACAPQKLHATHNQRLVIEQCREPVQHWPRWDDRFRRQKESITTKKSGLEKA